MKIYTGNVGRRDFLRRSAFASITAGSPFAANLGLIGAAAAQSQGDYKALVCIFLQGGNDQSNLVMPASGAEYLGYYKARPLIAIPSRSILPLSPIGWGGPQIGLSPAAAPLQTLFQQQHCAVLANVGTLVEPITKDQWNRGRATVPVPKQLFSHADQQGAWQTGVPDRTSATGWLGRVGDLTAPSFNATSPMSICVSLAGNNLIQTGARTLQYQLTVDGTVRIDALDKLDGSAVAGQALRQVLTAPSSGNLFEQHYASTAVRSINVEAALSTALDAVRVRTPFPSGPLADQLAMVAKVIAARQAMGQGRQIFFVSSGGWDFHEDLVRQQALRLKDLSGALSAFYAATVEMGVSQSVTSFTASDFGRTLLSNGRGADHGWGSHHFIVGGAVNGGRIYGQPPMPVIGGPEDAGQGRLIPTTSVDEYAATLATWFGVGAGDLSTVLPNIGRFATPNLGFMAA